MLRASWLKSKVLVIGWFVIMNVLFFLPGTALPERPWFIDIQIDKWVHIGLFAVLVFLLCCAFDLGLPKKSWIVLVAALSYGLLVEVLQGTWIPNRSFDGYDILADAAGSVAGLYIWLGVYKKNKPL